MSVKGKDGSSPMTSMIAGVLNHISEMTAFLNPTDSSYERLGSDKAPKFISWSSENRSQLVRIPAAFGEYKRAELRSPDPAANPYLAFALLIYAGLDGIQKCTELPRPANINLYKADEKTLAEYKRLPQSREEAIKIAKNSDFIKEHLPEIMIKTYCK